MRKVAFLFFLLFLLQAADAQNLNKIVSADLNLRVAPGTFSKVITIIPKGTSIDNYEECNCEWMPIDYKGNRGYINTKYLKYPDNNNNITHSDQTSSKRNQGYYQAIKKLNVRELPSTQSSILGYFPSGQNIVVDNFEGDWAIVNVQLSSGDTKIAYIYSPYLKEIPTSNKLDNSNEPNNTTYDAYHNSTKSYETESINEVKHYKNSSGERVQSPTYYDSAPEGATALCRDGTYSFSRSRRGTCSHHGGVARWL